MTPAITATLLGLLLAGGILYLVRRDHVHGSFAVWWLMVAAGALVLGFFPTLVDRIGLAFGVQYPPMLVALVGIAALMLKLLALDIDVTRRERKMRRLLQKVAILEAEMRDMRTELDALGAAARPQVPPPAQPLPPASEARRSATG